MNELSKIKNNHFHLILEVMRRYSESTVLTISEKTELSIPTVKKLIDCGLKSEMIFPSAVAPSTGGRKAQLYHINSKYRHVLYFALDNDELHCVLKDFGNKVAHRIIVPVALPDICTEIEKVYNSLKGDYANIALIGIAIPAVVHNGVVMDWYYNPDFRGFNFQEYFQSRYNVCTVVENDMKLTALAAGRYSDRQSNITLSTLQFGHNGIGLGQMVHGKILNGAQGFAGEIAFLPDKSKNIMSIRYCAKIVNAMLVFTNPELVVFYHSNRQNQIQKIMLEAGRGIPEYAMPRVVISDAYIQDVLDGLELASEEHLLPDTV